MANYRQVHTKLSGEELVEAFATLFDIDPGEPPMTEEETDEFLREMGYDPDEIARNTRELVEKCRERAEIDIALDKSIRKVEASLRHAASGKHQDYPPGMLELGIVLDAIDMIQKDVHKAIWDLTNEEK